MTLLTMSPSNFETLIGRLHPLVVHLPIGILLLLALFEFLGRNEKYAVLRPAIVQMAFWGMISAIFSCIAGYILSKSGGYDKDLLAWHKWFGIAIAVLTTAFYVFKKIPTQLEISYFCESKSYINKIFVVSIKLILIFDLSNVKSQFACLMRCMKTAG
jgi:uncharacterized membrane protein